MSESVSHPSGIIREFYRHEGGMAEEQLPSGDWRIKVSRRDFPTLTGEKTHYIHQQALAMAILDLDSQIRKRGGL